MVEKKQILTIALVFLIVSLCSFFSFSKIESNTHTNYFYDMKVAFELVTTLTADSISSAYCHRVETSRILNEKKSSAQKEFISKILSDYPYVNSISIYSSPSLSQLSSSHNYRIYTADDSIFIDFKVFNSETGKALNDNMISAMLNSELILTDIRGNEKFSFVPDGNPYGYFFDKSVYSVLPAYRPYQILASLLIGFFFAFWTQKSLYAVSGFFYKSRGLKKLITIFEHAERYSANHSRNVAAIAESLGMGLGLRRKSLKDLRIAALFHDIGKIAVPVSILNKKGRLSMEEFEIVKTHTSESAEIIQDFEELAHLSPYIKHHHEKMDGTGYPSGLKGEEIPLYSRIIAVADIFEALVGVRPYRHPMAPRKALLLMETEMSLDPVVLSILRKNFDAILKILKIRETLPNSA